MSGMKKNSKKKLVGAIRELRDAQRAANLAAALENNEQHVADGDVLENGTWRTSKRAPWAVAS